MVVPVEHPVWGIAYWKLLILHQLVGTAKFRFTFSLDAFPDGMRLGEADQAGAGSAESLGRRVEV
jgi:hypothetical protein